MCVTAIKTKKIESIGWGLVFVTVCLYARPNDWGKMGELSTTVHSVFLCF